MISFCSREDVFEYYASSHESLQQQQHQPEQPPPIESSSFVSHGISDIIIRNNIFLCS